MRHIAKTFACACAAWLSIAGLAGCDDGCPRLPAQQDGGAADHGAADTTAPRPDAGADQALAAAVPDVQGTWAIWLSYGEEEEEALMGHALVEQQDAALTVRDMLSGDEIAAGTVSPEGLVTFDWVYEGAGDWQGRVREITTATLPHLPDSWTIDGIIDDHDPLGLKRWWAERVDEEWVSLVGAGLDDAPGNGHQQIIDAGLLPYDPPELQQDGAEQTSTSTTPEGDFLECKSQAYSERIVSQLKEGTLVSEDVAMVYPGSLLQGLPLAKDGDFLPVKIPRAGGTLFLSGLMLDKGAVYSRQLDELTASKTNQAINELLTDSPVQGTAANAIFNLQQVYSYEQLLLSLGIDAKFGGTKIKNDLSIDSSTKKNYVLATFTQIFYTVTFETPVRPEDVFKDGASFSDPDNAIRPGNPPMYISSVSYGRQVYFLVDSTESALTVKNTLNGAWSGLGADVKVNSDMTYKDVLKKTNVTYWVRGGAADLALQPISAAQPDQMYDALKTFLAQREAANFSPANPGLPVSYTVKYLMNDKVVAMNMSAVYDKVDCHIARSGIHKWEFVDTNMNYRTVVIRDGATILNHRSSSGGQTSGRVDFSVQDTSDHTLSFVHSNGDCFSCHGNFYIYKDGLEVWRFFYHHGVSDCGEHMKVTFKFNNRAGGQLETQSCAVYRGVSWRRGQTCDKL